MLSVCLSTSGALLEEIFLGKPIVSVHAIFGYQKKVYDETALQEASKNHINSAQNLWKFV